MSGEGEKPRGRPEYKVYRSRRRFGGRSRKDPISDLREDRPSKEGKDDAEKARDLGDMRVYRSRRGAGLRRGLKTERPGKKPSKPKLSRDGEGRPWWKLALIGAGVWILISIVAFGVSAQIQKTKLPDTGDTLSGGNNMITGPATILVIGGDQRGELHAGDATAPSNRPLADTIMLIRTGGGVNRKLSIPRDTLVEVPGFGEEKINSAFAQVEAGSEGGNVELLTQTVEDFLDLEVNHVVVVSFDGFVDFIDAVGGVEVDLKHKVCAVIAGGRKNGGQSIRRPKGEQTLNGEQALLLSRIRRNSCNPRESDVDRAERQQVILSGIKSRLTDPLRLPYNFIMGPIIGWTAPKAIVSDLGIMTMPQVLFAQLIGGGGDQTSVLKPSGAGPGGSLIVSESERQEKVERFLDG